MVRDFNIYIKGQVIHKINKETLALYETLEKIDLIGVHRTFHRKAPKYTFFSSNHKIFSRTDHKLGHKTILNKIHKFLNKIHKSF